MNAQYENKKISDGFAVVIGCDEVGRGCLAGPVVAAAVTLVDAGLKMSDFSEIRDSKLVSPKKRAELAEVIKQNFVWALGIVPETVIDEINIHNASLLAMRQAVEGLLKQVSLEAGLIHIAVDGKFSIPSLNVSQEAVIGGDNKIFSIAAASIVAKVFRDELMTKLHEKYPLYNFIQHKGYATLHHRRVILQNGLTPVHRRSFCDHLV